MLTNFLASVQQVMFFSTKIFKLANLDDAAAQYATLGMGSMNVLMTLVSLVLVERAGRKTLLLIGFIGMCIDTVFLTIALAYVVSCEIVIEFEIGSWRCALFLIYLSHLYH